MTDIMIDIETLSTKSNATILTIAAVKFKRIPSKIDKNPETFYVRVTQGSCKDLGMDIDKNTLEWWGNQNTEARYEAFDNTDRIDIKDALVKLSDFVRGHRYIWANSPNFDCVILEDAYNTCNLRIPWMFWNLRDCRTIYDIGKVSLKDFSDKNTTHNALNDCFNQIKALQEALKKLVTVCF